MQPTGAMASITNVGFANADFGALVKTWMTGTTGKRTGSRSAKLRREGRPLFLGIILKFIVCVSA
jgi:hypothetical protein